MIDKKDEIMNRIHELYSELDDVKKLEWEKKPIHEQYNIVISPLNDYSYTLYFEGLVNDGVYYNISLSWNNTINNKREPFESLGYCETKKDILEQLKPFDIYKVDVYTHGDSAIQRYQRVNKNNITKDWLEKFDEKLVLIDKTINSNTNDTMQEFKDYFNNEMVEVAQVSTLDDEIIDSLFISYSELQDGGINRLKKHFGANDVNNNIISNEVYIKWLDL